MLAVLFSIVAVASSAYAREYACIVDEALCTGNGAKTITMDIQSMCCPPFAELKINNGTCLCAESPLATAELACRTGPSGCRDIKGFATSSGNVVCCLPNYQLTMHTHTDAQGQVTEQCRCVPSGNGGFVSSFLGLGNGGRDVLVSGLPGPSGGEVTNGSGQTTGNTTDVLEQWRNMKGTWKNWGQQFAQDFRTWGRNLGQNMRNTGLDLARDLTGVLQTTLTRTTVPLQRALNRMMGNIFRSIPSF